MNYQVNRTLTAGIVLMSSEVKAIRTSGCVINGAFCHIINNELFVRNMKVPQYPFSYKHHDQSREKKLLVKKKELKKLVGELSKKGTTLIPAEVFCNKSGFFKVVVAVCSGKSLIDRRKEIIERDIRRSSGDI